jgi:hypothetical protein
MGVTEEHDARNAEGVNEEFVGRRLAWPVSPEAESFEAIRERGN